MKQESKKWLSPKKIVAVVVGSISLTAVGVKAFEAEDSNDLEISGTPIEITTDTSSPDMVIDSPSTTITDESLIPDNTSSPDTTVSGPDTTLIDGSENTGPITSQPETTDPGITNPPDTTSPEATSPDTTFPEPEPQDTYQDICVPMSWTNCGEYEIYDASGNLVNRVIANSDWTTQYIASISGGGADGNSVKLRDIYPR